MKTASQASREARKNYLRSMKQVEAEIRSERRADRKRAEAEFPTALALLESEIDKGVKSGQNEASIDLTGDGSFPSMLAGMLKKEAEKHSYRVSVSPHTNDDGYPTSGRTLAVSWGRKGRDE